VRRNRDPDAEVRASAPLDAVAMSCCARYRVATAVDATGSKQLLKNRLPQVVAALTFSLTPHAQLAPFGSSVVAL